MSARTIVTGIRRHAIAARRDDLYETPPPATRALLAAESIAGPVWEPACGPGALAGELRAAGLEVFASDLVDYDWPGQDAAGWDFLMEGAPPLVDGRPAASIVTNPPYKLANQFIRHAIRLVPYVALLLRLAFLESEGRRDVLEGAGLARVHVFRKRLPMMHRHGWAGPRVTNSAMAMAWFVWERGRIAPAEIHRISWEPIE